MPLCDGGSITQKGQMRLGYSSYMTKVLVSGKGKLGQFRFDAAYMQQDRGIDLLVTHYEQLYFGDIEGVHVAVTIGISAWGSIV